MNKKQEDSLLSVILELIKDGVEDEMERDGEGFIKRMGNIDGLQDMDVLSRLIDVLGLREFFHRCGVNVRELFQQKMFEKTYMREYIEYMRGK